MTCTECIALSGDYIDGLIDAFGRSRFEDHLRGCPACARYVRVLRRGLAVVRGLDPVEPSPEFRVRLHRRLHGLAEEQRAVALPVLAGAGVTLAVVATVAVAAWLPLSGPTNSPAEIASAEQQADRVESLSRIGSESAPWRPLNGWSPWVRPTLAPPSSMTVALPGPYSPLVVQPPSVGRPMGRAILAAYLIE